jgi:hypothetical protein
MNTLKRWLLSLFFRYIYTDEKGNVCYYITNNKHKRHMMPEMIKTFWHLKWFKKINLRDGRVYRVDVERQRAKYCIN